MELNRYDGPKNKKLSCAGINLNFHGEDGSGGGLQEGHDGGVHRQGLRLLPDDEVGRRLHPPSLPHGRRRGPGRE